MKNYNVEIGRFCKSLKGRDAESIYIITAHDENFVRLCDGDYKKLSSPKKKSIKHIELLSEVCETIANKIKENKIVHNEEIYSRIKTFKEQQKKEQS